MFMTHCNNAREMVKRALASREKIYAGFGEAKEHARQRFGEDVTIGQERDEEQKWRTSNQFKALASDNQWNMQQADMYNNLAQTEILQEILNEQIAIRHMLGELVRLAST